MSSWTSRCPRGSAAGIYGSDSRSGGVTSVHGKCDARDISGLLAEQVFDAVGDIARREYRAVGITVIFDVALGAGCNGGERECGPGLSPFSALHADSLGKQTFSEIVALPEFSSVSLFPVTPAA